MRLLKVLLRNVKSYGDRPVEISFADGVNLLSGKNGAGKSTIIEAIGYALFDVLPYTQQDFLRRGAKTGMVAVWIEDGGERFRIERKFGSITSWVVYDRDDVSLCEKKEDVLRFLCKRFHVSQPSQLQEVFQNILGVRQGTYTALFTMSPARRKAIFDQIINVHVYRECSERRGQVRTRLLPQELHALDKKIEAARSYIEDHREDPARLEQTESRLRIAEEQIRKLSARKAALEKEKEDLEGRKAEIDRLERLLAATETFIRESEKALQQAESEATRCAAALEACRKAEPGHRAWLAAESRREVLEGRRAQREQLRSRLHELEARRQAETAALEELAADLARRRRAEQIERENIQKLQEVWTQADGEAAQAEKEAAEAAEALVALESAFEAQTRTEREFLARLEQARACASRIEAELGVIAELQKELSSYVEVEKLAAGAETAQREALRLHSRLSRLQGESEELERYKQQLAAMVCPFIKEPCDRVKPAVLQEKIADLRSNIEETEKELEAARKSLQTASEAQTRLAALREKKGRLSEARSTIRREWAKARFLLAEGKPSWGKLPEFPPEGEQKMDLAAFERYARDLQAEVDRLGAKLKAEQRKKEETVVAAASKRRRADAAARTLADARTRLEELQRETAAQEEKRARRQEALEDARKKAALLEAQLKEGETLDAELAEVREILQIHRAAHEEYVQNERMAQDLDRRREDVERRRRDLAQTHENREKHARHLKNLAAGYDAARAASVAREHETTVAELATVREEARNLAQTRSDLAAAVRRLREQEADLDRWTRERRRLMRFNVILEDVWVILKALGPRVSRRLLGVISSRADRIFGHLHDQPGRLIWDKEYEVRLKTATAEYSFGNLSGGEQMSAALAIQMAMARWFVNSSFCIFDEPTIHLDESRRRRLAAAVREAQVEAGFKQVFIVSHDDTFGPYVDHEVKLAKSGASGTVVVS